MFFEEVMACLAKEQWLSDCKLVQITECKKAFDGCNSRIVEVKNKKYLKFKKQFSKGKNGYMKIRRIKESFRIDD